MADYVIDTNVWIQVDRSLVEVQSKAEIDCIDACRQWLRNFMSSEDRLIADESFEIFREYRRYVKASSPQAYEWLNALQRAPRSKLVEVVIAFDENKAAIIPFHMDDEADRKFVAVALAHQPTPTIVDATDTDWEKDRDKLTTAGITVQELCPDYIQEKLKQ